MRAKPPWVAREPDTMGGEKDLGMPEVALGTDGKLVCTVVLFLLCLVAVGTAMWFDRPREDSEEYGCEGDAVSLSGDALGEVTRADAMIVDGERRKGSLSSVREESDEGGSNPSRDSSPRMLSNKKED